MGHRIWAAPDAGDALHALDLFSFDVLLVDLLLPRVSGMELLQQLRASGQLPPYLITMSVLDREDARPLSRQAGCHAHLHKPFGSEELVAHLERACAVIH